MSATQIIILVSTVHLGLLIVGLLVSVFTLCCSL